MSLVLRLPLVVKVELLRDWISTESLARFDTAICCSYLRPEYLHIVRQKYFYVQRKSDPFVEACGMWLKWYINQNIEFLRETHYILWLSVRGIKCSHITVDSTASLYPGCTFRKS